MKAQTLLGRIDQIKRDPYRLKKEYDKIRDELVQLRVSIERRLTPKNIPPLLTALGIREIDRVSHLVDYDISDFSGYCRYIRAIAIKKKFTTWEPLAEVDPDEILELCEETWKLQFHLEMVRGFLRDCQESDKRRMPAGMMHILNGYQSELMYIEDANERARSLYEPFSREVIERRLGISVDDAIRAFEMLRSQIPARMDEIAKKQAGVHRFFRLCKNEAGRFASEAEMLEFLQSQPGYERAGRSYMESIPLMARIFVFTVSDFAETLGDRAAAFLEAFSFEPGSVNASYTSPFDTSIHRSRPFAKIDDGYLLVDPTYCYFTPRHRFRECFDDERLQQRLTKRRDLVLEDAADALFSCVFGEGEKHRSYYIQLNENGDLAERDLIFIRGDVAFVVESKAKPPREAEGNITKIESDFKKTIQEGYDQCVSVCRLLIDNPECVTFFDSNKPNRDIKAEIHAGRIRRVVPVVFLDAYYGIISTDLSPWLRVDAKVGYPWVVDRDAMSAFTLKFTSPKQFLEFFDWRTSIYGIAHNEDELCFAGYFLRHGAVKFPSHVGFVNLDQNYSDVFEKEFFRRKGLVVDGSPDFVGAPHFSEMSRDDDEMVFRNGNNTERLNVVTGESVGRNSDSRRNLATVGRNDRCPRHSGKKYKKCCGRTI